MHLNLHTKFSKISAKFIENKRGQLLDPILSSAYLLKIVVTILICLFVWTQFSSLFSNIVQSSPNNSTIQATLSGLGTSLYSIDYIFPLLVGGLMIVSIIFAFKTGTNIVWGIFAIIVWAIALLFATVFENIYLMTSDQFISVYTNLPILDAIMTHLTWIVFFWIAAITAVMFRKNNAEDESSQMQRRFYGK